MQMQPCAQQQTNARNGVRGDAILAVPDGSLVLNIKVVHTPVQTNLNGTTSPASAEIDGAAALGAKTSRTQRTVTTLTEAPTGMRQS